MNIKEPIIELKYNNDRFQLHIVQESNNAPDPIIFFMDKII